MGRTNLSRGRGTALGLMLLAAVMLAAGVGLAMQQRAAAASELDDTLVSAARHESQVLANQFDRARAIALLSADNPAFQRFYEMGGSRLRRISGGGRTMDDINSALIYLQRLYPDILTASFVDREGGENARADRLLRAPVTGLSRDQREAPFFIPAFSMETGDVYQSAPFVSPSTGQWVISFATPVPSIDGVTRGIVQYEMPVETFRIEAWAVVPDGIEIRVVEAPTSSVVIDAAVRQGSGATIVDGSDAGSGNDDLSGFALGDPTDERFDWLRSAGTRGLSDAAGVRVAYEPVIGGVGNENHWVVAAEPAEPLGLFAGVGPGTASLVAVGLVLLFAGARSYRAVNRELADAVTSDSLTGIGNRRKLMADLDEMVETGAPFALGMFDLDGFKHYNDTFGHPAGDALLIRLSAKLTEVMSDRGCAYRLGGDEFCILTERTGEDLDDLLGAAMLALSEQGDGFEIGCSHGIVRIPDDAADAEDALRQADKRMYAEKHGRRLTAETQSRDVLVRALLERHPQLGEHRDEVADLAEAIARRFGAEDYELARVRRAAELHDIGKVAIPEEILSKNGPLTDEEWRFMIRHSEIGERILDAAPALHQVAELIRHHHERWDGSGYPDGLAADSIPLGARIVAVCDAYHAMLSPDRAYGKPRTRKEALDELRRCAGSQFDPEVVEALCALLDDRRPASTTTAASA
ncbi:MAG: HD domain-containing phosphohydrolase [Actinomycetota bacterium]